jgi:DNA-binding transcriptional LysR family regulator
MQMMTGIRMFVLAMQHGSLAAAARQMGTSTASISRQIAALETQLKVRLFNRGKRMLTPTEAGEMLLRRARPMLAELDEMIDSVSLLEAKPRGRLRVNIRALTASRLLVPALPRFLTANPEVEIDLFVSNDEDADLIADNIDVDIRYTRPDSTDLVAKLLAPSQLVLIASADYVSSRLLPENAEALGAYEVILYEPEMGAMPWQFVGTGGEVQSYEPQGRMRVNDGTVLRSAILAGLGIGMMPLHEVDEELAAGTLVQLLPHHQILHPRIGAEGIFAVYQKSAYQPGKLRSFLSFLPEVFAKRAA